MQLFDGPHVRWTVGLCANCETPLEAITTVRLWCSDFCQGWAKDVRYFRRAYRDGRAALDPKVQEALQTRMAHLVADGYRARDRALTRDARLAVMGRNGGLCVACNEHAATEVDHIDGDSPDPSNLQGLCHPCHQKKTASHYVPMEELDHAVRDAFLAFVREDEPVMLAHSDRWDQERRALSLQTLDWALETCSEPFDWPPAG